MCRRQIINLLLLCLLATAARCGNGESKSGRTDHANTSRAARSNLLLIVLDAASAKHFGCYGYSRKTTPVVDSLAAESWLFRRAYTNAVYTLASTASLMTGLLPERHGLTNLQKKLPDEHTTLAELFSANGYRTAAFLANGHASSTFGLTQGFQNVQELFRQRDYTGWAKDVTNAFLSWVDKRRSQSFFAYLHYREPHDPYNPPSEWIGKFTDGELPRKLLRYYSLRLRTSRGKATLNERDRQNIIALYDANLAYADAEVGRVLQDLKRLDLYNSTTIIVTSDHGEAFWEHGLHGHNKQLYEESIQIPLVVKLPDSQSPRQVDAIVSTVDVFATVAEWFSLKLPDGVDGVSFGRQIASGSWQNRVALSASTRGRYHSLRSGDYKYIRDSSAKGKDEMYHLRSDPDENRNLIFSEPELALKLKTQLTESIVAIRRKSPKPPAERPVLDEATKENLKALGYVDD